MTLTVTEATWTFVGSPAYAAICIVASLVAILVLVVLVFQQELVHATGVPDDLARLYQAIAPVAAPGSQATDAPAGLSHRRANGVTAPLVLCFAVIVVLRLVEIAYPQPQTGLSSAPEGNTPAPRPTATAIAARMASQFYFAGGVSSSSEHTFVDLLNPTAQVAGVQLTFFFGNGAQYTRKLSVLPASEQVIPVASLENSVGPFGLRITANQQIAAQLRLSRDGKDGDSLPGSSLGTSWYLAEGYTDLTFHESVAILNPDPQRATQVVLHLLPQRKDEGSYLPETVAPHSQLVIDVNSLAPSMTLGMVVTADRPVAVTRALTFGNNAYGVTLQAGSTMTAKTWSVAAGTTTKPIETFLLLLNPSADAAHVTARFYGTTGKLLDTKRLLVGASERATLRLNDDLSAARFSSVVESDQPIVVEQAEYSRAPNSSYSAGSDVLGSPRAASRWLFADGDTTAGKSTELLQLFNPTAKELTIEAAFYGTDGKMTMQKITVGPHALLDVDVSRLLPRFAPLHGAVLRSTNGLGFFAQQILSTSHPSTRRST
jgi:hypothetical protein